MYYSPQKIKTMLNILSRLRIGRLSKIRVFKSKCTLDTIQYNLKKDTTKVLETNGSLMKVESIAECSLAREHSAKLLICIKR